MWLAFLIPDKLIYEHGAESVEIFTGEGLYPFVGNTPAEELDNWTDSLMIHTACYQKEDASALERAVAAYRPVYQDADPITSFRMDVKGIDNGMEITSYARYWHGYLVFLRPLLFFMDYQGIRALTNLGVVFTLLLIIGTLIRQKRYCLILPFLCTALFLRPLAIAFSIQFSSVLCDDIQPVFDFGLSESNGTGRALSVSVFDKWHDNCLSGFTDLSCGSTWNSTGIFPGNGENG